MRQSAAAKGARYLTEGRLCVTRVSANRVDATARGDGHLYHLGWSPRSGWWCTCLARGRCSHLFALGAVVAVDLEAP